jgi:hypothetical protein
MTRWICAISVFLCAAGCGAFDVLYDRQIIGPYYLVAIDESTNMQLCLRKEAWCEGDGLPAAAIFAAGGDDRYVVIADHPHRPPDDLGSVDRSVVEYYYIERARDDRLHGMVTGPLTQPDFELARARLHLPPFTISIDELR